MLTRRFETNLALGGDATIVIVAEEDVETSNLFTLLWRQIFEFERRFSRFLPASELSSFNQQAGLRLPVSREFYDLFRASLDYSRKTNDLYNPFVLPALQRSGYLHSAVAQYAHDPVEDFRHRTVVSSDKLELHADQTASIPYGTALDTGGCGKGYLADQIARLLTRPDIAGFWISLSGDMLVSGTDEYNKPWTVTVQSAKPSQQLAPIAIHTNGSPVGVATSGTLSRPGQGHKLHGHHIIDPRTGKSADTDIVLATVVAEDALQADILASCAVILGSAAALPFLRSHGVHAAFIQTKESTQQFGSLLKPRQVERTKSYVA